MPYLHRAWILEGRNPPERQPLRVERAQEEIAEGSARVSAESFEIQEVVRLY